MRTPNDRSLFGLGTTPTDRAKKQYDYSVWRRDRQLSVSTKFADHKKLGSFDKGLLAAAGFITKQYYDY